MAKRLFAALLLATTFTRASLGGDETQREPSHLSPFIPVTQESYATSGLLKQEQSDPTPVRQSKFEQIRPSAVPTYQPVRAQSKLPERVSVEPIPGTDSTAPVSAPTVGSSDSFTDAFRPCAPASCFWVRGEYLLWWTKGSYVPPLITTGVAGTSALPGVLGQPDTTVLFGGSRINNDVGSGGRFTGGLWLDHSQSIGLEGSYFFLGSRSTRFDSASNGALGSPVIARPFFDVSSGIPNAQLVAFPGLASGEIHLSATSRFQGAELNLTCNPCCTPCDDMCADQVCLSENAAKHSRHGGNCDFGFNLLGGFRYLQLDERLAITENSRVNSALPAGNLISGGSIITINDQFDVRNSFYGGQVGAQAWWCCGRMFVNVVGKVALGATHQVVDIHGSTSITSPAGSTVSTPIGFLASGSNSGQFTRDRFAVVPEVGINVGYQITRHMRASLGYTCLYWSSVVRAGDQVDTGLSGTQIPTDSRFNPQAGPDRPTVLLNDSAFWAQGINFGVEYRY